MKLLSSTFLAIMPVLALLSTPPSAVVMKSNFRSIASVSEIEDKKLDIPEIGFLSDVKKSKVVEDIQHEDLEIPEVVKEVPRDFKNRSLRQTKQIEDIQHEDLEIPEIVKSVPGFEKISFRDSKVIEDIKHSDIEIDKKISSIDDLNFKSGYPRFEALVSKVDPKAIARDVKLDQKKLATKKEEFKKKLAKIQKEMKEETSDKKIVSEQRSKLESLVVDLLLIESSEDAETKKLVEASKNAIENLLGSLDANEKPSSKKVEIAEAEAKEEAVEVKKVSKQEEESKHVCDVQGNASAISKQMEQLMSQQNQITQTMLQMSQMMMMNMMQNMQNQQRQPFQYPNQQAYQYNQPTTAGNWVYYPQGFQPSQPNIFAQQPQSQPQQQWGLQPQQQFQMPQPQMQQQMAPGNFGMNNAPSPYSFNLSSMPVLNSII